MDPVNKKHVWEMIQDLKTSGQGRIIVLTTHSMEEADALGDQIAIIAFGRLRALGSALFLLDISTIIELKTVETKEDT